jgi:hypothetical protein
MRNPSGDDQKDTVRPRSRATRRQESEFQVLVIWTLLAGGFGNPSSFVWAFWLPTRSLLLLVRHDSLLQVSCGNYAAGARGCNRQIKAVATPANPQELLHPCKEAFALRMSPGVLAAGFSNSQQLLLALVQIYRGFDCSFDEHVAGRASAAPSSPST